MQKTSVMIKHFRTVCAAIRGFANSTCHGELTEATDAFISENLRHLTEGATFATLPSMQFDIIGELSVFD